MHQKHTICVRTSTTQAISDWATITTVQQGKNTVKKLRKNIDIIYISSLQESLKHPAGRAFTSDHLLPQFQNFFLWKQLFLYLTLTFVV